MIGVTPSASLSRNRWTRPLQQLSSVCSFRRYGWSLASSCSRTSLMSYFSNSHTHSPILLSPADLCYFSSSFTVISGLPRAPSRPSFCHLTCISLTSFYTLPLATLVYFSSCSSLLLTFLHVSHPSHLLRTRTSPHPNLSTSDARFKLTIRCWTQLGSDRALLDLSSCTPLAWYGSVVCIRYIV